jgi:hypothetical protein
VRKAAVGHIYVLELSDGITKVGYTNAPAIRLGGHAQNLKQSGREIVRHWMSPRHIEAGLNEETMIAQCEKLGGIHCGHEKAREWFSGLRFDDVVSAAQSLPQTPCDGNAEVNAAAVRNEFGKIMDRAQGGQPTHVMRYGNAVAVFVPPDWYERAVQALAE